MSSISKPNHPATDAGAMAASNGTRETKRSHKAKVDPGEKELLQRPGLVSAVVESLEHDGLAVICSEVGLGRHSLAKLVCQAFDEKGIPAKWLRLNVKSDAVAIRRVRQAVSSCVEEDVASLGDPLALLVIDGVGLHSEETTIKFGKAITGALFAGIRVIVILMPEHEYLIDELPRCKVFGARDLVLKKREVRTWCGRKRGTSVDYIVECTHGIASLVSLMCASSTRSAVGPGSAVWTERVAQLYESALRNTLIDEELTLRCAMAAFGSGSVDDLQAIGVRASSDLLLDVRSCCPLFGIEPEKGLFECVPIDGDALREILDQTPAVREGNKSLNNEGSLLCRVARRLASKGNFARAGALLWANPLERSAVSCVSNYPLEFIDAGHLPLVTHAALHVDGAELSHVRRMLRLLGVTLSANEGETMLAGHASSRVNRVSLQIELLEAICGLKKNRSLEEVATELAALRPRVMGCKGILTQKLYQHYRALALWFEGSSLEAFRELMLARELRGQDEGDLSLFSAVLQFDFEALRRVIGDPISLGETELLKKALRTLEASTAPALRGDAVALVELAGIVSGEKRDLEALPRAMVRWQEADLSRLLAWACVMLSFSDSLGGQARRAYVRATGALDCCERLEERDVRGLAQLARWVSIQGLGESLDRENLELEEAVEGCSPDVRALLRAYAAAAEGSEEAVGCAAREMRAATPRMGVAAMAGLATRSGPSGKALRSMLPLTWRGKDVASSRPALGRQTRTKAKADAAAAPILRISIFGGITVSLGDECIPEASWRRRQAKVLLAMLALTPGHLMQRHEIIAALWPDVDLARGREYLYTVLSSLRSSIGQTPVSNQYVLGEMGQIRLDPTLVSCDVDEFESMVRRISSRDASDDEVVSLCVALEGLYSGGSFVPATDALGCFRRRHDELAQRYRDAMLAGAEAASRLRDARQAAWFTQVAKAVA